MKKLIIDWDGEHLPSALKQAPPGRYILQAVAPSAPLSEDEDQGLSEALRQLDAGQGLSLAEVIQQIRTNKPDR